jgi:hypothetical protein
MSASCFFDNKMIIEEDESLTPKLKQMKLNSQQSEREISKSEMHLNNRDYLKIIFPTFTEDVIFYFFTFRKL